MGKDMFVQYVRSLELNEVLKLLMDIGAPQGFPN